MQIIEKNYKWSGYLVRRPKTNYILVHHAAGSNLSPDDIHKIHLGNGWAGIGYHFYVRKDGTIYRGRPIESTGSHVSNYNSQCLGVCFEGNFEKEQMPTAQLNAGKELIAYLKGVYPNALVRRHKDLNATACPGRYFPFDNIVSGEAVKTTNTTNTTKEVKTVTITLNQLAKGSEGKQVETLQRLLISMGYSCGDSGIDGDFGTATEKAVKAFQNKKFSDPKEVDGIVGSKTWEKLLK